MRLGDILSKLAREEPLSGAEIETLRMLGNTLQNLIGLAGKVDPNTGHITELTAGNVEILRTGLYGGDRVVFIDQNGISVDVFEGALPGAVGGTATAPAGKYQYKFVDATGTTATSLSTVKASDSSLTQTLLHARRTTGRDAQLYLISFGGLAASSDTATTTLGAYANATDVPLLYNEAELVLVSNPGVSGATTASLFGGIIYMGEYDTSNRLVITDGVVSLTNSARVTKYAWIPASAARAPGEKMATYVDHGISGAWRFADGQEEYIHANIMIPDDMDLTANCTICIGWSSTATEKNCDWEIAYLITAADEDTTASADATEQSFEESSDQAEGLVQSPMCTIAGNTIGATDVCLHISVLRDGNDDLDTLSADAELHGIALQYTANKLGG